MAALGVRSRSFDRSIEREKPLNDAG